MSRRHTNADKSITDYRLCLHRKLTITDMSGDNLPLVEPTAPKSVQWPFADHKLSLKRSTSAESVLMADSYQLVGAGLVSAVHYRHRTDRSTQTPQEWEESDKGRGDSIAIKDRQIYKESNEAKPQEPVDTPQGHPTNRDQSTQIYDCDYRQNKQSLTASDMSPVKSTTKSGPIAIPSKLCVETSRSANSVEELNQEIEYLVLRGLGGGIGSDLKLCDKIPEGHRAPIIELLCPQRTTQTTPQVVNSEDTSAGSDQSQPESPLFISEANELDNCSSPKINKFLTREPPDGCEKIKIMTEDDRANLMNGYPHVVRPVQPSSGFVLLPSRSSAFLPIFKANDLTADCIHNRINYRKS